MESRRTIRRNPTNGIGASNANKSHTMAMFDLIDDIMAVKKNPHASIIQRLKSMKNSLSLEDPMPLHDVTTLDLAIKALQAHS